MAVAHQFLIVTAFFLGLFSVTVIARTGTATYYNPPYTTSACYGYRKSGVMIAAASHAIWNNRGACGTKLRVKCLGATNRRASYPCNTKNEVIVDVVDYCPSRGGTIDLSGDAFSSIASLSAGRINIEFLPL